jgi:demethylmenaquinone methyltransferase/2-methoxy-6-polyprenyl-1,4-benzoquinol methylase
MDKTPETLLPYDKGGKKPDQVEAMFDTIAPSYDFMNRLMSFRQDIRWRRKALKTLEAFAPKTVLDVATGTGDFAIDAFRILHPDLITGIDLSEEMMKVAEKKVRKAGIGAHFQFERQDCMALSFSDESFDAVIVAFGVRNFENIAKGIAEMHRVLKPGGRLVILELSRPSRFPAKQLFRCYSTVFFPAAGRLFSNDKKAYEYLPASIQLVPQGKAMTEVLAETGFEKAGSRTFTLGVCSLYFGTKPACQ